MDKFISESRKRRLKQWIDRDFEGNVAAFVRNFSLPLSTASYISQLFSGGRNFGEKAARQLESQTGMPAGWFDAELSRRVPPGTEPPLFRYNRDAAAKLPVAERELVSEFIEFLVQRRAVRSKMRSGGTLNVSRSTPPTKNGARNDKPATRNGATYDTAREYKGRDRRHADRRGSPR